MAEEKTIKQLKKERTIAKSLFTRQHNMLMKNIDTMVQGELMDELNKLSECLKELFDTNDNYEAGLLSEIAEEEEKPQHLEQQEEIDKTAREAEEKFKLAKETVRVHLWSKYGMEEVNAAIQGAEDIGQVVNDLPVLSINVEGYNVHMTLLEKRLKEVTDIMLAWERWIPGEELRVLNDRIKNIKRMKNKLELRKADFVTARRAEEAAETVGGRNEALPTPGPINPIVRIKPTSLPMFNGNRREFHRWRKDWESLQRQGEPSGSSEVKKIQLLDSIESKIVKDLTLTTYPSAEEIFRILENRYGNKSVIAIEILEDLDKIPPVRGNEPRKVIDLIQAVEKALADLTELANVGAIKNPLVIKTIERKLPDFVKRDWLTYMLEANNNVTTDNHFDKLLTFLKKQEGILERLEQLKVSDKMTGYPGKVMEKKFASTKATKKDLEGTCVLCGEERHYNKLFFCKKFKSLRVPEKMATVKRLGACKRCLGWHSGPGDCKDTYLCRNKECRGGGSADHHYFLCSKDTKKSDVYQRNSAGKGYLTDEQEQFLSELPPEMAEKCKRAFSNGSM